VSHNFPFPLYPIHDEDFLSETGRQSLRRIHSSRDVVERFVRHPLVSPVYGDLTNLPPILIQAGDCELLRDESIALAYKYKKQNQQSHHSWVRHELYIDMIHVFQAAHGLPASRLAMRHINHFIKEVFRTKSVMSVQPLQLTAEETKMLRMIDSHHVVS
jgi:acetyl esterase/lipase